MEFLQRLFLWGYVLAMIAFLVTCVRWGLMALRSGHIAPSDLPDEDGD